MNPSQIFDLAQTFQKLASSEYLYHVTYYRNLDSIAVGGLQPSGSNTLSAGYAAHAKNRVFVTEADGIGFWYNRCEQFAEANSDNPYEDGWVPIVLRVPSERELNDDDLGSRDAMANAYYVNDSIPSDEIEMWNGSSWVSLDSDVDTLQAFDVQTEEDDETGEETKLYYFKSSNPLDPS